MSSILPSVSNMSQESLVSEDIDLLEKSRLERIEYKWQQNWSKKTKMMLHLATLASICILLGFGALLVLDRNSNNVNSFYHCGDSPADAVANGCFFDVMSFTWVPQECFNGPLMLDFLAQRNWTWYLDGQGQQQADETAVRNGAYNEVFVSWEYHLTHCVYMWQKMHHAILHGDPYLESLDGYIGRIGHTEHCGQMLLGGHDNSGSLQETNTMIYTKYPACGKDAFRGMGPGWYRIVDGERSFTMPAHKHHMP